MKKSLFALMASTALLAGPAMAEEATAPAPAAIEQTAAAPAAAPVRVRTGQTIYSSDDARLGQIDRVSERSAFIRVSGGRLVPVPLSSLSRQDGHLVSTFSREQVLASN